MMSPFYEISAAPHFPRSLRASGPAATRPEAIASVLLIAAAGSNDVKVTEQAGEIYIAVTRGK